MGVPKPKPFVRDATGLVREVGSWPAFFAVWGLITSSAPIYVVETLWTAPGANWVAAWVIAFFPSLTLASLAIIMAISMPRSGADYVFTSRALHPFLGFVNYFALMVVYAFNIGILAFWASTYLGFTFSSLGIVWNDTALLSLGTYVIGPVPSFILAVVTIAFGGIIALSRPSHAWRFMFWAGIISLFATLVFFGAMMSITPTMFKSAYDTLATSRGFLTYAQVLSQGGLPSLGGMAATSAALPLTWLSYSWFNLGASWAGEAKNVRKNMWIAIMGALTYSAVYYIAFTVLSFGAFGQDFLTAWSNLSNQGSTPAAGVGAFTPFFVFLVYPSFALLFIILIALWLPTFFACPVLIISQTRYIFSWAFDRILPEKMADVSERFHTPLIASAFVIVGALVGAYLQDFYASFNIAVTTFPLFTFGFIIPAIAAILFPYLRRDLYETAVVVKRKIVGIPILTLLGVATFIYLIFSGYLSVAGGYPVTIWTVLTWIIIFGSGAAIYLIGYSSAKRRGIPIEYVFKEIPPE